MSGTTLIVYRGRQLPFEAVYEAARRVLGGHLRPDANLVAHASAPIRVDRRGRTAADPLAGTVRVLHLAVPEDADAILTDVSRMVLPRHMGFPDAAQAAGWDHFGHAPSEAVALQLSERSGPVATLSIDEEESGVGSYSILSAGRRLWSASFRRGASYATWDGTELRVEAMAPSDPIPVEGAPGDFPAHGLNLLFTEPLELTPAERMGLVDSLVRACRKPTESAEGCWLVQDGRFIEPGRTLVRRDWDRFTASFRL